MRPSISQSNMSIRDYPGTEEFRSCLLPVARRLRRIFPMLGLSKQETEERARRFYLPHMDLLFRECSQLPDRLVSLQSRDFNSLLLADDYLPTPYIAAVLIRRNYEIWEQYLSDPSKGVPTVFQYFAGNKSLIYYLAALSKHGIINLDPSKPFLNGELISGEIHIESERPQGYIEKMLSLWDSLERPKVNSYRWFELAHGAAFSPSRDENIVQNLFWEADNLVGGNGWTWGGGYFGLCPQKDTVHLIRIERKYPEKVFCRLDTRSLIESISMAMVFDLPEIAILDSISELIPQIPALITESIRLYRVCSISPPFPKRMMVDTLAQDFHYCMFGLDVPLEEGLSIDSPLHHSSALKHIRERPELFEAWAEDPEMKYLYRDLVEPLLRKKSCIR